MAEETLTKKELETAENDHAEIIKLDEELAALRHPNKKSEDYYKERVALLESSLRKEVKNKHRWISLCSKWENSRQRNS